MFEPGPATRIAESYSSTTPQIGLNWRVTDDLRIRATWGESFLTPLLEQQFGTVIVQGAVSLFNFAPIDLPAGQIPIQIVGSNISLGPQNADTMNVGFDYSPSDIPGFSVSATYGEIEYESFIAPPLANASLAQLWERRDELPGLFITDFQRLWFLIPA